MSMNSANLGDVSQPLHPKLEYDERNHNSFFHRRNFTLHIPVIGQLVMLIFALHDHFFSGLSINLNREESNLQNRIFRILRPKLPDCFKSFETGPVFSDADVKNIAKSVVFAKKQLLKNEPTIGQSQVYTVKRDSVKIWGLLTYTRKTPLTVRVVRTANNTFEYYISRPKTLGSGTWKKVRTALQIKDSPMGVSIKEVARALGTHNSEIINTVSSAISERVGSSTTLSIAEKKDLLKHVQTSPFQTFKRHKLNTDGSNREGFYEVKYQGDFQERLKKIKKSKTITVADFRCLLEQLQGIAKGLRAMQIANVMHGDLKPENIFMNGQLPVIADFDGAVDCTLPECQESEPEISIEYMDPRVVIFDNASRAFKRVKNSEFSPSFDMYSFGKILEDTIKSLPKKKKLTPSQRSSVKHLRELKESCLATEANEVRVTPEGAIQKLGSLIHPTGT